MSNTQAFITGAIILLVLTALVVGMITLIAHYPVIGVIVAVILVGGMFGIASNQ